MSNDQIVEDTITQLFEHVRETMAKVEKLSGRQWLYVLSVLPASKDDTTPEVDIMRTIARPEVDPCVLLRLFAKAMADVADAMDNDDDGPPPALDA